MRPVSLLALALCAACSHAPYLTVQPVGQPHVVSSGAPPAGMRVSRSDGEQCFTNDGGQLICPTRGTPLRSMPPLLRPDAPQDVALEGGPGQPSHPECYSGSQLVPCDESFGLREGATAVAEDGP